MENLYKYKLFRIFNKWKVIREPTAHMLGQIKINNACKTVFHSNTITTSILLPFLNIEAEVVN